MRLSQLRRHSLHERTVTVVPFRACTSPVKHEVETSIISSPMKTIQPRWLCQPEGKCGLGFIIIIIIRQPLCPVVGRRPQHVVSKLPCLVLSSAISCRSSICPGRLSTAWLVSLVVFSFHMVSKR